MPGTMQMKCPPSGGPNVDIGFPYMITDWVLSGAIVITLVLRVYSRGWLTRSLGSDDVTMILTVMISLTGAALDTVAHKGGFGRHCEFLTPQELTLYQKYASLTWLIAFHSFFFLRTSVMLFTLRLLPRTKKKSAWVIYMAFILNVAITLVALISYGLQCRPFNAIWRYIPDAQCVSQDVLVITNRVNAILNVFIDIATASVPAFLLWGVQMKSKTKITLHTLFWLGMITAGLSIGRAVTITPAVYAADTTYRIVLPQWFALTESKIGMCVANAPALRQMFAYRSRTNSFYPTDSRQTPNSDFQSMRSRVNFRDWVWRGKKTPARGQGRSNAERLTSFSDVAGSGTFGVPKGKPFGATDPEDSPLSELQQRTVNTIDRV